MKLKIAIVGTGRWGQNLIREFGQIADIAYAINRSNIATDYPLALADQTISAIIVATPIDTHFAIAKQALKAGKHVFLEKPGTASEAELAELINLAESKKLGLQIGYIYLHHSVLKYLVENLAGPIKNITTYWQKFGSFGEEIALNLACHDLAIINALTKQSPTSQNLLFKLPAISSGDILSLKLDCPDGLQAIIQINRVSNTKQKTITITTDQALWLWQDNELWQSTNNENYKLIMKSEETPLTIECTTFIKMITTEPKVLYGDIALSVHQTLAKI